MAKYIYIGKGDYMNNLPARDIDEQEWESYPEDVTKAALHIGLYELEIDESDYEEDEVKDA